MVAISFKTDAELFNHLCGTDNTVYYDGDELGYRAGLDDGKYRYGTSLQGEVLYFDDIKDSLEED